MTSYNLYKMEKSYEKCTTKTYKLNLTKDLLSLFRSHHLYEKAKSEEIAQKKVRKNTQLKSIPNHFFPTS